MFEKWRQGSGGTYFITAQAVVEKVSIHPVILFLRLGFDFSTESSHSDSHQCDTCSRRLNEKECEVLDNLPTLERSFEEETILSSMHISG